MLGIKTNATQTPDAYSVARLVTAANELVEGPTFAHHKLEPLTSAHHGKMSKWRPCAVDATMTSPYTNIVGVVNCYLYNIASGDRNNKGRLRLHYEVEFRNPTFNQTVYESLPYVYTGIARFEPVGTGVHFAVGFQSHETGGARGPTTISGSFVMIPLGEFSYGGITFRKMAPYIATFDKVDTTGSEPYLEYKLSNNTNDAINANFMDATGS